MRAGSYYGKNFVAFVAPDERDRMDKASLIEAYKKWSSSFRQKERVEDDLKVLSSLPERDDYYYMTPQWTGHVVMPEKVRSDNGRLYEPVFISTAIEW